MNWPHMTEDLNVIKLVWAHICYRLEYDVPLKDPYPIYWCWDELKNDYDFIIDAYHSMNQWAQKVIRKRGDYIEDF